MSFKIVAPFKPTGDQPTAIRKLSSGIIKGDKSQVLLGVTGSGKTFTIANVVECVQKPTLILAHNKTLAAQNFGLELQFKKLTAQKFRLELYNTNLTTNLTAQWFKNMTVQNYIIKI